MHLRFTAVYPWKQTRFLTYANLSTSWSPLCINLLKSIISNYMIINSLSSHKKTGISSIKISLIPPSKKKIVMEIKSKSWNSTLFSASLLNLWGYFHYFMIPKQTNILYSVKISTIFLPSSAQFIQESDRIFPQKCLATF